MKEAAANFFKFSGKGGEQFEERRCSVAVRDERDTSGPWFKDLTASVPGACTLPARNRFTNLPPFALVLNSIPNSNSVLLVLPSTVIFVQFIRLLLLNGTALTAEFRYDGTKELTMNWKQTVVF